MGTTTLKWQSLILLFLLTIQASLNYSIANDQISLTRVTDYDLPQGIQNILYAEQVLLSRDVNTKRIMSPKLNNQDELFRPEKRNVFVLKTYWIPEKDLKAFEAPNADRKLTKLMKRVRNGVTEWRLVVHPESENFYAAITKKGTQAENFLATSTASSRTLVVWPKDNPSLAFFGKLSLDKEIGSVVRTIPGSEVARSVGTGQLLDSIQDLPKSFQYLPESMGIIPKGMKRGGMIIREIPENIKLGKEKFVPLFSLYGKCEKCKSPPLLLKMINKSKMKPDEFVRTKIISPFLDQWLELAVKHGISTEPHAQNVLIGIGPDGLPNGNYLHRDFGGFNIDFKYRREKNLSSPDKLAVIDNLYDDYHQKHTRTSLKQSLHTYFSGGFVYNLDQNMSQWAEDGLIPKYFFKTWFMKNWQKN